MRPPRPPAGHSRHDGKRALVIGGGIGAVTAAAALGQKGLAVTLIECSDGSGVTDLRTRQNIPTIKN